MKNLLLLFFLFFSISVRAQIPKFNVTVCDTTQSKGYYFFCQKDYIIIIDSIGNIIYFKHVPSAINFALQQNNMMSYSDMHKFYLMNNTFNVVDSFECKNISKTDPREFRILPNGHFLLLGADTIITDLSKRYWNGSYGSDSAIVIWPVIQEQDVDRNVVFEWHAKDYYSFDDADTSLLTQGKNVDIMHSNALEPDNDGNILLSTRNFNEIAKINHANGSIMWRFGGKKNQFKFVNCPVPFYGQHDIRRIGNGHVTLYDNGVYKISHGARAMEFELDEKNKIATLIWSYTYDSTKHSLARGNVQRLKNSNTLVNYGIIVDDSVSFVVVDEKGTILFQIDGMPSYRAFNYSSLPFQLHRPQVTCFDSSGVKYLDAGKGYASYKWSTGDSTGIIPIKTAGDYYVFVPYGDEGYISSEKVTITDIANSCATLHKGASIKQQEIKKR